MSVIWLTGLSGSGKTTIAGELWQRMESVGISAIVLDGDVIRDIYPTGFSFEDRHAHIIRVAKLAKLIALHGIEVIVSLISPMENSRNMARELITGGEDFVDDFILVYVNASLEECIKRDVKGLYAKATENMTGIQQAYEVPISPDIIVDTVNNNVEDCVRQIYQNWLRRG